LGRVREGQLPFVKWVRTTEADYEILKDIAIARGLVSRDGAKKPQIAQALEDALEIAYRCIQGHGAEFAKPSQHPKTRQGFKRLATKAGVVLPAKRKRGQRGKDKKPRRRAA
jgi:hypothetical protein